MTIVEALKNLVLAFGGSASDGDTVVEVLKDVNETIGGTDSGGDTISEVLEDVSEAVEDNVVVPQGKITITENGTDIDVSTYATADVAVEGSGGLAYASVALTLTPPQGVELVGIVCSYFMTVDGAVFTADGALLTGSTASVPMYGGAGGIHSIFGYDTYEFPYYIDESITPVCTGGVSWDSASHSFTVTGDGTITATLTDEQPK